MHVRVVRAASAATIGMPCTARPAVSSWVSYFPPLILFSIQHAPLGSVCQARWLR